MINIVLPSCEENLYLVTWKKYYELTVKERGVGDEQKKKQVSRLLRSTGEGSFVKRNESNLLFFIAPSVSKYLIF